MVKSQLHCPQELSVTSPNPPHRPHLCFVFNSSVTFGHPHPNYNNNNNTCNLISCRCRLLPFTARLILVFCVHYGLLAYVCVRAVVSLFKCRLPSVGVYCDVKLQAIAKTTNCCLTEPRSYTAADSLLFCCCCCCCNLSPECLACFDSITFHACAKANALSSSARSG